MDEIKEKKISIRTEMIKSVDALSEDDFKEKTRRVAERLFDFANFMEAKIPLLYMNLPHEIPTRPILEWCFEQHKIVVLPAFGREKRTMTLLKVDDIQKDLKIGPRGVLEPDPNRCKRVPIDQVDIAVIPGVAFDEKGGRIGSGLGYYDRLIPKLSVTTRKVALILESHIIPQVPMESHDKYIDIIITDQRIIYKI
ncbi:5-formyltetrahydrofolate cyclo-ligase [Desulfococcus sp.]|uniref:5-formyltetrahydrofolate cyclo-ligase n=1 Tax=Desulfococcus sp. TaxID=2025834 RepID=UPI003593A890